MSLSATLKVALAATHTNALDLATATFPLNLVQALTLTDGTGANQADRIFTDTRTLAASATEDLDLAGSLTDAYGTVTFARVKAILVIASAANTNNVNVTRPASNGVPFLLAAGDGMAVRPGGIFLLAAPDATGYVVTATSADLITFTNSAGSTSVDYTIVIIGASA